MRIRDIVQVLQSASKDLRLKSQKADNADNLVVSGVSRCVGALKLLEPLGLFEKQLTALLGTKVLVLSEKDEVVTDAGTFNGFNRILIDLVQRIGVVVAAFREWLPAQSEDSVGIRLPDAQSLESVADSVSRLDKALNQALLSKEIGADIRLVSFDRGSLWIELSLGSSVALILLGRAVSLYYRIKEKKIEYAAREILLDDLEGQADLRKKVRDAFAKQLETEETVGLEALAAEVKLKDDNEYRGRLKFGFKELAKLMDRGLEVHPSLTAPQKTRDLFPSAARLLSIQKQLEDVKPKDGEESKGQ